MISPDLSVPYKSASVPHSRHPVVRLVYHAPDKVIPPNSIEDLSFALINDLYYRGGQDTHLINVINKLALWAVGLTFPFYASFEDQGIASILLQCLQARTRPSLQSASARAILSLTSLPDPAYVNVLVENQLIPTVIELFQADAGLYAFLGRILSNLSYRDRALAAVIRQSLSLGGICEALHDFLHSGSNMPRFRLYCEIGRLLVGDDLVAEDAGSLCAIVIEIAEDFETLVDLSEPLLTALVAASDYPVFVAIASGTRLGAAMQGLLETDRPDQLTALILAVLAIVFAAPLNFEVNFELLLHCCLHSHSGVRSCALFCVGRLCEAAPAAMGEFRDAGIGAVLSEIVNNGSFFERAEAAVVLSLFVCGESPLAEFSVVDLAELFAEFAKTPGSRARWRYLEALSALASFAPADDQGDLVEIIAGTVDELTYQDDVNNEREQAAIATLISLIPQ
jgi:hypothetical protein